MRLNDEVMQKAVAAVAEALGAVRVENPNGWNADIYLDDRISLQVITRSYGAGAGKATVRPVVRIARETDERVTHRYLAKAIGVTMVGADPAKVAAAIRKRIDFAAAARRADQLEAEAREADRQKAAAAAAVAAVAQEIPGFRVISSGSSSEWAWVYNDPDGPLLVHGRLTDGGAIYIDRTGGMRGGGAALSRIIEAMRGAV